MCGNGRRVPCRGQDRGAKCRGVHGDEPRRNGERARGRPGRGRAPGPLRLLARRGRSHDAGHPIDETRPPMPVTDYGRSKLAAEVLVRAMPPSLPWTIVRPPVVYGEWDRGTLKIFQLARRGVVPVFGDGSQELSVIHAEDLARSLIAAATSPAAAGRVYFAAHPTTTTSRALVLAAGRAMGARGPRIIPVPPFVARGVLWAAGTLAHMAGRATLLSADKGNEYLAPAWTCRSDALTRDTGWQAGIELETGLRRAAKWYRAGGWLYTAALGGAGGGRAAGRPVPGVSRRAALGTPSTRPGP